MGTRNPEVDSYIARAKPFAQPILKQLRELVHAGCPEIVETIRWRRPFFEYRGSILAFMAAFASHCSFGFWGQEMRVVVPETSRGGDRAAGPLGRIASVNDLPLETQMVGWIRQAARLVDMGEATGAVAARSCAPRPETGVPADFAAALKRNRKAAAAFAGFPPGARREYIDWVTEAKRDETRAKRIATAMEWIEDGKERNWKYQ